MLKTPKIKLLLYIGIILLTGGIILAMLTSYTFISGLLIVLGGVSKVAYLISRMIAGTYRPGFEIGVLVIGLVLFFIGLYFKNASDNLNHLFFMIPGLLLKGTFVIFFIKKLRN